MQHAVAIATMAQNLAATVKTNLAAKTPQKLMLNKHKLMKNAQLFTQNQLFHHNNQSNQLKNKKA